ncbi:hypothetical protein SARC_07174, partial [Sphaeroforma arctica JP610]
SDYDAGDFSDAEEEEKEALRMQREQAELLDEDDYLGDTMLETLAKSDVKKRTDKEVEASDNMSIVTKVQSELNEIDLESLHTIVRDTSSLTREEKLELILNDSPELLELTEDLQDAILELRGRIAPVRNMYLENRHAEGYTTDRTPQAIAAEKYLDTRFHLLVNYCMNLSFYLYLKANHENVKNHPVIAQVVRLRELKERLEVVDESVQQEVDFLVAYLQQEQDEGGADNGSESEVDEATSVPVGRQRGSDKGEDEEESEEEYEDGAEGGGMAKFGIEQDGESDMDVTVDSRASAPSANRKVGGFVAMPTKVLDADVQRASEKAMLGDTKKAKRAGKRALKGDDYGESEASQHAREEGKTYKSALHKHHEKKKQKGPKQTVYGGGDDDVPNRKKDNRLAFARDEDSGAKGSEDKDVGLVKTIQQNAADTVIGGDGVVGKTVLEVAGDVDADLDYYQELVAMKKKRKDQREEMHTRVADYLPEDEAEGKRGINWQIQKNKGLTQKKQIRNPRVKHKIKYDKAMIKRKHVVKQYKVGESGKTYGGEHTGVKSGLSRSVKLTHN